jgi:hypothetical protein
VLTVCWRASPQIDRHIEHRSSYNSYQLGLRDWRNLEMKAADGSLFGRNRLVLLNEFQVYSELDENTPIVGFSERTPHIWKFREHKHQNVWYLRATDLRYAPQSFHLLHRCLKLKWRHKRNLGLGTS